jgi:hypothetical protein
MGFGYYVSLDTRKKEVIENEKWIKEIDNIINSKIELPVNEDILTIYFALLSFSNAEKFGLTTDNARDLAMLVEYYPDWLDTDNVPNGWYPRGEEVQKNLISKYGEMIYPLSKYKEQRKLAVNRLRKAKKANK